MAMLLCIGSHWEARRVSPRELSKGAVEGENSVGYGEKKIDNCIEC